MWQNLDEKQNLETHQLMPISCIKYETINKIKIKIKYKKAKIWKNIIKKKCKKVKYVKNPKCMKMKCKKIKYIKNPIPDIALGGRKPFWALLYIYFR